MFSQNNVFNSYLFNYITFNNTFCLLFWGIGDNHRTVLELLILS